MHCFFGVLVKDNLPVFFMPALGGFQAVSVRHADKVVSGFIGSGLFQGTDSSVFHRIENGYPVGGYCPGGKGDRVAVVGCLKHRAAGLNARPREIKRKSLGQAERSRRIAVRNGRGRDKKHEKYLQ